MQRMDFAKVVKLQYLEKRLRAFRVDTATVYTSRLTGRLKLNRAALQLMDIKHGANLYFFDLGGDKKTINERLFLTKGFEFGHKISGSQILENGVLNNSILYNTIMSKGSFTAIDNLRMVDGGYFIRHGKEKYLAIKKATMTIEKYIENAENGEIIDVFSPAPGIEPQPIYVLRNCNLENYI